MIDSTNLNVKLRCQKRSQWPKLWSQQSHMANPRSQRRGPSWSPGQSYEVNKATWQIWEGDQAEARGQRKKKGGVKAMKESKMKLESKPQGTSKSRWRRPCNGEDHYHQQLPVGKNIVKFGSSEEGSLAVELLQFVLQSKSVTNAMTGEVHSLQQRSIRPVELLKFACFFEDQALQQSPSIGMHLDHLHQRHQRRESAIPRVLHVEFWQLGRGQFGCWDLFCSQDQWQAAIKQASWAVEICFAVLHLVKTKIATKANPCVEFWFARPASGCTWTIYIRDIREQKAPPPEYCIWNFGSWAEGSSAAEIFCSQDERQMPWPVRCIPSSGYQAGQLNCWNLLGRFAFCEGQALQQLNQANGLAFWVTACRLLICQTIIGMHLDHPRQRHQRRGSAPQLCLGMSSVSKWSIWFVQLAWPWIISSSTMTYIPLETPKPRQHMVSCKSFIAFSNNF